MMYHEQLVCPSAFPWSFANIIATKHHVVEVMFSNQERISFPNQITTLCKQQLASYFAKERTTFCLPMLPQGTSFSISVYNELLNIYFGSTTTYQNIAINLGGKNKSRAVGHACSLNKIAIIVPCHRVISSTGGLTGYAGGLETKKWLINHEKQ